VSKILEATNKQLGATNEELVLANKIKEEYVGYYFSVSSQMIEKLEKFKNSIYRKFTRKQFDELAMELDSINIHKEKAFLYKNFDQVFLQIFPDFVRKINSMLKENEHLQPKEGHLLNTELRIYALIRLGISDNEKIAKILDNSVNTIYSYKTKVRNMAKLPKEEFEQAVMKIKRF
jgi:DNA-binding CsgD family transcriptional regulator